MTKNMFSFARLGDNMTQLEFGDDFEGLKSDVTYLARVSTLI